MASISEGRKRWVCPRCGKTFAIPVDRPSPEACKSCLKFPDPTTTRVEAVTSPVSSRSEKPSIAVAAKLWPFFAVLVGAVLAVSNRASISTFVRVAGLCGALLFAIGTWLIVSRALSRGRMAWFIFSMLATFIGAWFYVTTAKRLAFDSIDATEFIDTVQCWSGRIVEREIRTKNAVAYGPLSESKKRHGHWRTHVKIDLSGDEQWTVIDQWFWYESEITEGEWHLRNR